MKDKNCPFCYPIVMGLSPEGWVNLQAQHDSGHKPLQDNGTCTDCENDFQKFLRENPVPPKTKEKCQHGFFPKTCLNCSYMAPTVKDIEALDEINRFIIELIEYGVSLRTGWLTEKGKELSPSKNKE